MMNKLLSEWRKFLLGEDRRFAIQNLQKIYEAADQTVTQNVTADVLDSLHPEVFFKFIRQNDLLNIFSNYEIDEMIGTGQNGIAFSLKEPHENYVLKIEMHISSGTKKRPGVDYTSGVYAKQQQGQYERGQVKIGRAHV